MIKEFLSASAPLNLEIFGLIVFVFVFAVINVWVFRKSGKTFYAHEANLPLTKEKEV